MGLPSALSALVGILDRWQTLIAGVLALGGAWLTVRSIRQQIAQVTQIEQERRLREERAARAVLPLALYDFFQYTLDCITQLRPYMSGNEPPSLNLPNPTAPQIPASILEPMQTCSKFSDPAIADKIQHLLHTLQGQHYHLTELFKGLLPEYSDVNKALAEAAELNALTFELFDYARGVKPNPSPRFTFRAKMISALFRCGIVAEKHPELLSAIDAHLSEIKLTAISLRRRRIDALDDDDADADAEQVKGGWAARILAAWAGQRSRRISTSSSPEP